LGAKTNFMLLGISGELNSGKDTVVKMVQYYFAKEKSESKKDFPDIEDYLDAYENWNLIPRFKLANSIHIKKYATKLKQMLTILVGCKLEDWENQEFKNTVMPDWLQSKVWEYKKDGLLETSWQTNELTKHTYRWLAQNVGTEFFRNGINQEVWINALFAEYLPERVHKYHRMEYLDMETEIDFSTKFPNWIITDVRFPNEADAITIRGGKVVKVISNQEQNKPNSNHSSETELRKIKADFVITIFGGLEELYAQVELMIKTLKITI
jgi:hypothetical protein